MKFGLVHRIMTNALAALGVLALVTGGQFARPVAIAIVIGLVLALSVRESWQRHPAFQHLDTVSLLGVLALQVGRVVGGTSPLDAIVEFAAALQLIRLATRRGAAHDQQVIVLALLHLIAGTVLGGGLVYGLCFLGVVIVAPGALVLSHLRREVEGNYRQGARDRTGLPVDVPRILRSRRVVGRGFLAATCLLSIPICLFTALLFVTFPRVGLSLLMLNRTKSVRNIGFTNRVDLGEVGVLRADATLAMRVEVPNLPASPPERMTFHLRGTALDAWDGRAWTQSSPGKRSSDPETSYIAIEHAVDIRTTPIMRIDLEPIDPPVLFLPPAAHGFHLLPRASVMESQGVVTREAEGEYRYTPSDERGTRYEVFLGPPDQPTFVRLREADRERYLALPDGLPARIGALAYEWTRDTATPYQRARAIEEHLRTEYRYDLASPSPGEEQPLDHFLFESKRGHCEFYSTAMAVMLRYVGVPTRNVTGFIGGTYNRIGRFYAVRQGDAHSWVEAYIDGRGWLTFDPTPSAESAPRSPTTGMMAILRDFFEATSQRWDQHVVNYDLAQQESLWRRLRPTSKDTGSKSNTPPWKGVVVVLVVGLAGLAAYRYFTKRQGPSAPAGPGAPRTPSAVLAIELYERLEVELQRLGVARVPSTPPLRHAEALARAEHPAGAEVLTLTETYVAARYGGRELSLVDRRDFEARLARIAELASPAR
jgi:transglutaminase-like putative cysteine protease